jgi:hypothetical protein
MKKKSKKQNGYQKTHNLMLSSNPLKSSKKPHTKKVINEKVAENLSF